MSEYASSVLIRSKCKELLNSVKKIEDNARALNASANAMMESAVSCSANSKNSALKAEGWAANESKLFSVKSKENKDYVSLIVDTSRSYAVGDIGFRDGEEFDNAKYYLGQSRQIKVNYMKQIQTNIDEAIKYIGLDGENNVG